jgi:signal transduction histidine kinase
VSRCGDGMVERGTADLLKNLRALARGKHDDFSVASEAADEIERLLSLVERMLFYAHLLAGIDPRQKP